MSCKNCYIPNRTIPDMDTTLFNLLKKLPFKCEIRLIGAEPTMRKDLPEIISKIRELKHRPVLITNGLRLANKDYTKKLKTAGVFIVNISLNGGIDDNVYKKTDGGAYACKKIKALENCIDEGLFINTNTILLKGVNEKAPLEIYNLLENLKAKKAVMRFRNVGQLGRYMLPKEENYTYKEMIKFMADIFGLEESWILNHNTIDKYKEKNTVLFPVKKTNNYRYYVKITDWSPPLSGYPDPNSIRRGRVTQDFKIAPFFEHLKRNEFRY